MKISKQKLLREAATTEFRPEILEKVWYLMALLDAINDHSFLKAKLVLKGGTALNLFMFDLPRLSVDIDLNYIGAIEREAMMAERPLVEQALEAVFKREELVTSRIPGKHAGGKWRLKYESALGGLGKIDKATITSIAVMAYLFWEIYSFITSKHHHTSEKNFLVRYSLEN